MKRFFRHVPIGVVGGLIYMGIEIIWRGYTHWTMGILGGLCFIIIGMLDEYQNHPPIWKQMIQGAVIVTALELCLGTVVNIILGWNVWDYSNMPGNFLGQICPQFTLAWLGLSWVAVHAENLMHKVQDLLSQNKRRKS